MKFDATTAIKACQEHRGKLKKAIQENQWRLLISTQIYERDAIVAENLVYTQMIRNIETREAELHLLLTDPQSYCGMMCAKNMWMSFEVFLILHSERFNTAWKAWITDSEKITDLINKYLWS